MPAVIIRTSDQETINKLREFFPDSVTLIQDETTLNIGYNLPNGQPRTRKVFPESDEPVELHNEPSLKQAKTMLNGLTPRMKMVLRDLVKAKKFVGLQKFNRELNSRDIEDVRKAFVDRAKNNGFLNEKGEPVELITVRDLKDGLKWRLAQTARRAIEVFEKEL